jgi:glycosyltransferase involved in cell wall biosynthesis
MPVLNAGILKPDLSVVVPCYNEESNAAAIAEAITREIEKTKLSFDIIFIDNASTDNTVEIIRDLCTRDERIKLIVNTRNFGQMRSPTHCIFEARGSAIIGICADFQDPPELIGHFIERWQAGIDIVLGIRTPLESGALTKWLRAKYYEFDRKFSNIPIIPNATGFGIYDRKVVDKIAKLREPAPFFRRMLVETGYTIETIEYPTLKRAGGVSSNNLYTIIDFALTGISASSRNVVRLPYIIGLGLFVLTPLLMIMGIISLVMNGASALWFLMALFEAQFAALFIFLGLFGEQLNVISERTRETPLVFERERINFPEGY